MIEAYRKVFGMDDVVEMILGFVPHVASTNRATARTWRKVVKARLKETFDGTGLQLESVQQSFGAMPDVRLEAIIRTMRNQHTRPVVSRNCSDGLVFMLSLVVGDDELVLRFLEAPRVEWQDGLNVDGDLLLFFDTEIATTRTFYPPIHNDDLTDVASMFRKKSEESLIERWFRDGPPQDVAKEPLIMKVSVFDRTTNKVAHLYDAELQERGLLYDYWYDWDDRDDKYFGFRFDSDAFGSPSHHIHVARSPYAEDDTSHCAHAEIFFNVDDVFRRAVIPNLDDLDLEYVIARFRQWPIPIGTTFTTVKLAFENIDDIAHLKAVLDWVHPQ